MVFGVVSTIAGGRFHRLKDILFPDRGLFWIVVVGFVVRLAFAPWTSWTYDAYPFYQGAVDVLAGIGPYGNMAYSYPPAFAFTLTPLAWLLSHFSDPSQWIAFQPALVDVGQVTGMVNPVVTAPAFNLVYKLPLIITDYLTGVVLYHFAVQVKDQKMGRRVFILWFLNPLVIFVSSIYGNFDIMAVFFSVLSFYCMYRRMYLSAGLAVGLGVAFKLFPMYLALFYLAYLIGLALTDRGDRTSGATHAREVGRYVLGGVLGVSSILITMVANPSVMVFLTGRLGTIDMGGINVWGVFRTAIAFKNDGGVPTGAISAVTVVSNYLLVTILFLILIYVFAILRGPRDRTGKQLLFGSMTVFVILLLFQAVTHAHYLLWTLPFLLLCSVYQERYEMKFALLSIVGVVFWLSLQSYMAFLYPLGVFTGLIPVETINRTVLDYYLNTNGLSSEGTRLIPVFIGVLTLFSALVPEDFDPIYWLQRRYRRWVDKA
jgi:hypothetical protein